jgi:hypothetical protein
MAFFNIGPSFGADRHFVLCCLTQCRGNVYLLGRMNPLIAAAPL